MKKLLEVTTNDGGDLYIEVEDVATTGTMRGMSEQNTRGIIDDTKKSFEKTLQPLKDISNSIINCVKDIANSPQEVEVELGLRFTASAGIILTSLDSEAHLRVSLKWKNDKSQS